ncbi:DUF58 domain-containing protein [Sporosalibacterium faouarense]|uniref:DUF58 domain-containing protein n=1 Tax=Sporosalibacterium faouarense TaxID=516123 RepID=UPI00192B558B|nr:DUF58 domain-containing protein [Sporosalibacterium faouarense]
MNKRLILSIIFLIVLILFALLVGGSFPYLLLFLVVFIYGYSILSHRKIKKDLIAVFWSDKDLVEKGDIVEINYKLYNSSLLPLVYAEVNDNISERLNNQERKTNVYFMTPFDTINIIRKIKCQHRGIYDVGKLEVVTGDIFGLKDTKLLIKDPLDLTVYPKVYNLKQFNISGSESFGSVTTTQKFNEDYSSIKNIRKYQQGDSIKRVNWKVTARKGELFVKNYDVSTNVELQLFMDFQSDKYSKDFDGLIEEKIVECAISIVRYALYRKVSTNFVTYTHKKIELRGKDIVSFRKFLELSARIRPTNNINLGDIIVNESRTFSPVTTVIIVTPKVEKKLISSILILKKMGYNIMLILANDFQKNKSLEKDINILEKSGVDIYKVDLEDDIRYALG